MRSMFNWRAALLPPAIFLGSCTLCNAQSKDKWLALAVVAEFRITPYYTDNTTNSNTGVPGRYYSQDKQNAGFVLGFDVRKSFYKHFVEGAFGIRFKYGHLLYENTAPGLSKSVNALTTDYLFSLHGRIPLGKEREIRIGVGHGFMHRGSGFRLTEVDTLSNGQQIIYGVTTDFSYGADFAALSYCQGGVELGIVAYRTGHSDYDEQSPFIVLTPFLKYDIWRTGRKPKGVPSD